MNFWVPENAGNLSSGYITGGHLSSAQDHVVIWLVGWLVSYVWRRALKAGIIGGEVTPVSAGCLASEWNDVRTAHER
jgi:hypothetical protein